MRIIISSATVLLIVCLVPLAFAIPAPEFAKTDIEGQIVSITWQAERQLKGVPGLSGSAGNDRTIKAQYQIRLEKTIVTVNGKGLAPFASGDTITLELEHPKDDNHLRKGMTIKVIGYKTTGDEGGFYSSFEKVNIIREK